jgi:sortase (surface protein transpeptidase)
MPLVQKTLPIKRRSVKHNRFSQFVWTFAVGSLLVGGTTTYAYGRYPEWFSGVTNVMNTNRQVAGRKVVTTAPKLSDHEQDLASVSYQNYVGFGNMQQLADAAKEQKGAVLRGFINMPATEVSRSIYLPIYEGVSPYILSIGAGVGQPNREMGSADNLPVFAHNMGDYGTWRPSYFSPLQTMTTKVIGAPVYTTNGTEIFEWKIDSIDRHLPNTQISVMDNEKNQKAQLTMIACQEDAAWWTRFRQTGNTYAPERIVLKSSLVKKEAYATAPQVDKALFPDLENQLVSVSNSTTDAATVVSNPNPNTANRTTRSLCWLTSHVPLILAIWAMILAGLIFINTIYSYFWRKKQSY